MRSRPVLSKSGWFPGSWDGFGQLGMVFPAPPVPLPSTDSHPWSLSSVKKAGLSVLVGIESQVFSVLQACSGVI